MKKTDKLMYQLARRSRKFNCALMIRPNDSEEIATNEIRVAPLLELYDNKFVISKGKVMKYGAFDTTSTRIYLNDIPLLRVELFISQLIEISELDDIKGIQIEFDRYNEQHNIEIELYLETEIFNKKHTDNNFTFQVIPCGCAVPESFYNELINSLKKRSN
ncbi:hypothetical protein ABD91_03250 [Lysinibacillus sphaericus]|uniref:hypothetical protein n=1 Tax=Lysinibacillus sphaericus TaxID=1421 RepID=UPI0018CF1D26|nr:hypothetical protein [Lysinibacillus sphaericus]MBG9689939.1 hypothetical protein [Lysinibacillus sphaericus]